MSYDVVNISEKSGDGLLGAILSIGNWGGCKDQAGTGSIKKMFVDKIVITTAALCKIKTNAK